MNGEQEDREILIIVSKVKKYIRSRAGLNTAANVAPVLSNAVRQMCNLAIESARNDDRKTVMDRDFISP
jgi:histone H3/H4